MFLNGTAASEAEIQSRVRAAVQSNPNTLVIVSADRRVAYDFVVRAMDGPERAAAIAWPSAWRLPGRRRGRQVGCPVFTDEHEEQSLLGWFLLLSVVIHTLVFWLWPQWRFSFVDGVGMDRGGIVELVILPGEPAIQPPAPPRVTPPVQDRPPRQQQAPQPQPEPEPERVVRVGTFPRRRRRRRRRKNARRLLSPNRRPGRPRSRCRSPSPRRNRKPASEMRILTSQQGAFEIPTTPRPQEEEAREAEPAAEPESDRDAASADVTGDPVTARRTAVPTRMHRTRSPPRPSRRSRWS